MAGKCKLKSKDVDYLTLQWMETEKNGVSLKEHMLGDCLILDLIWCNSYGCDATTYKQQWEREIKKMKRKISGYRVCSSAIHMDEVMEQVVNKEGFAYLGRKQELLSNRYAICKELRGKMDSGRKKILIQLEDFMLNYLELEKLLLAVKDSFEDILIYTTKEGAMLKKMTQQLQKNWGVVVEQIFDEKGLPKDCDGGIACVQNYRQILSKTKIERMYILCKEEWDIGTKLSDVPAKKIYAGFCYRYKGMELPYQMAVDYLYQRPENQKIDASFIDIYTLKCYNKS